MGRVSSLLCVTWIAGCSVYDVSALGDRGEVDAATTGTVDVAQGAGGMDSSRAAGGAVAGVGGVGTGGATASSDGGGGFGGIGGTGGAGGSISADDGGWDTSTTTPSADGSMDGGRDSSGAPPRHAFLEMGGLVSIEAEHFVASAPGTGPAAGISWENSTAQADTSGSCEQALPKIGVNAGDTLVGPELDYDLRFSRNGTYYAWLRLLGPNNQSDSVQLAWDEGMPLTYGGQGIGANSSTWVWKNGVSGFVAADGGFVSVKIQVTAGYHTLHVYMREDGVVIDKIVLSTDSNAPTGTGPAESSRE
jgi:hypothetical protein